MPRCWNKSLTFCAGEGLPVSRINNKTNAKNFNSPTPVIKPASGKDGALLYAFDICPFIL